MKKLIKNLLSATLLAAICAAICACAFSSATFEIITFSQWFERVPFEPVVLEPMPDDMRLPLGPFHSTTFDYVEMPYMTKWGVEPSRGFGLYQSHIPIEESDVYVKRYWANRDDVTIEQRSAVIDGRKIKVEIRKNDKPIVGTETEEVLLYFQLNDTYVICFCQNVTVDDALQVFEQHAKLVTRGDVALIQKWDIYVTERDANARATFTAEAQSTVGSD